MTTPQNREVTKVGSDKGTTKKNYTAIRYGNDHGDITFGRISKQGDVSSDVSLQASVHVVSFSLQLITLLVEKSH